MNRSRSWKDFVCELGYQRYNEPHNACNMYVSEYAYIRANSETNDAPSSFISSVDIGAAP